MALWSQAPPPSCLTHILIVGHLSRSDPTVGFCFSGVGHPVKAVVGGDKKAALLEGLSALSCALPASLLWAQLGL